MGIWKEGTYRVISGTLSPLGWGLTMTKTGKGRQLGGALDGQLVTWIWLQGDILEVETTVNGTEVVTAEGQVCSFGKKVSVNLEGRDVIYKWMSDDEVASLHASLEPDGSPVCNYPIRPLGKTLFLSGLPGSGKSSTGRALAAEQLIHSLESLISN